MDDRERKLKLDELIEQRRASQVLAPPPPAETVVGVGKPNVNSSKTLEKLRGLSNQLSAQLAEAREAHVVKITTLATELCDVQRELIEGLEARVVELESQIAAGERDKEATRVT